ncbi:hypothetical protein T484DRAFT_1619790 [Baffinella frigidus]|nr:hypothetical protein T484DRAFT_1619790 [Cryptophyta sp. CCMP2293]
MAGVFLQSQRVAATASDSRPSTSRSGLSFVPSPPLRTKSGSQLRPTAPIAVPAAGSSPKRALSQSLLEKATPLRSSIREVPLVVTASTATSSMGAAVDENEWLEEVLAPAALEWVETQNKNTIQRLGEPAESELHPRLLSIYNAKEKIPYATKRGATGGLHNFWQDASNPRGIWRRCSEEEYAKDEPKWETLLDIDALGVEEAVSWVWGGSTPLDMGPGVDSGRVIISLSRGGADATVKREFDLFAMKFVSEADQGFVTPEAKGSASYRSRDEMLIGTAMGEGTVTDSGYPRQIRLWRRGEPLESAKVVFEGEASDVSVSGYVPRLQLLSVGIFIGKNLSITVGKFPWCALAGCWW